MASPRALPLLLTAALSARAGFTWDQVAARSPGRETEALAGEAPFKFGALGLEGLSKTGEGFRCLTREQRPRPISLHKNCRPARPRWGQWSQGPFNQSPVVTHSCSSSGEATDPNSTGAAHPAYCCFRDFCSPTGAARLSARALATLGPTLLGHLFL